MTTPDWMKGPPASILLATDLSARCDRALDRAEQLAGQWQAELVALNVLEPMPVAPDRTLISLYGENGDDNAEIALQQLLRDVAGFAVQPRVRIVKGNTAEAIRQAAAEEHCELIVTGMARNEMFGRFLLGTTVEKLARMVAQPLLVVRYRPHGPYRKVVVATDFSEPSRHALHAAMRFFADSTLIVYHAYTAPLTGMAMHQEDAASGGMSAIEARSVGERFLAGSNLTPEQRQRLRLVVEYGAPEVVLAQYVRQNDIDLVVMGTHGHGGLWANLLGSSVTRLLDWLPCDTMIVRDPARVPPA